MIRFPSDLFIEKDGHINDTASVGIIVHSSHARSTNCCLEMGIMRQESRWCEKRKEKGMMRQGGLDEKG